MKFSEEIVRNANRVTRFETGRIRINADWHETSVVLGSETLNPEWGPKSFEELTAEHMTMLLALEPEVVLIGTGERQHFLSRELMLPLLTKGIGVECMDTAAACRTFNILVAEERRVVAGLIV